MKITFQRGLEFLIPPLCMVIGLGFLVFPAISDGNLPGGILDTRFNHYVLEHFYLAISGMADSFVNMPILYPWTKTVLFSDTFWGNGFIYAFFRMINFSPEESFAYWYLIGFILNFINAFIVLRLFKLNNYTASIGAFLFTFCIPMISESEHSQVLYRFYVPWALFTLQRFTESRDIRYIILTLLFCSLQLLTSIYLGVLLFYLLSAYAFVILCQKFRRKDRLGGLYSVIPRAPDSASAWAVSILLIIATFLAVYIAAVPYWEASRLYGFHRSWADIVPFLPQWQSYFLADQSLIWASKSKVFDRLPWRGAHQMFMGIIPLIAILYSILAKNYRQNEELLKRMVFSIGILVVFTLSIDYHSLYLIVHHIPGLSSLRNVARIILIMSFPIAYIVGRFIQHTWRPQPYLAIFMSLFLIIETTCVDLPKSKITERLFRLAFLERQIKQPIRHDSILVLKDDTNDWVGSAFIQLDAMLLSQRKGIRTMNGYTGNIPLGWKKMRSCQDVADVIKAGVEFRRSHGDIGFCIDASKLVLVGFDNCNVNNLVASNPNNATKSVICR